MVTFTVSIPVDLWIHIYSFIPAISDSYRELLPYMLICKLSYDCIHPRLFETMHIYPNYMELIRGWILKLPDLLEHAVHRVHITCKTFGSTDGDTIATLLRICKNARRLACWLPSSLFEHAAIAQAVVSLPNLRFLEINILQLPFLLRNSTEMSPLFRLSRLSIYFWSLPKDKSLLALEGIDLSRFEYLAQLSVVAYSYPDLIISSLLQLKLPPALEDIVVFSYVQWEHENPDSRVIYYKRCTEESGDEESIRSEVALKERPQYLQGGDIPLDDWAEITSCPELAVWAWAREAKKSGKKIFSRPLSE
ncbi:hypothetical protein DL96DRAFT_1595352 [Flagelloscypha sp. PMI_526]|nr:hypothetical protein DL96DRAFT_1595352 [Flagelloscypha sp. PMI_526]